MKKLMVLLASLSLAGAVQADIYTDNTGDLHDGTPSGDNLSGFSNLDIASVEIVNDASTITFTINLVGSIANPNDWGRYLVGINRVPGGDTTAPVGNPWALNITYNDGGDGMDTWLGSWVNGGGGAQVWNYSGSWAQNGGNLGVTLTANSLSFSATLASMSLNVGDSFDFDVYSTGANDGNSAVDALSLNTPSVTTWGGPFDTGSGGKTYTVVPEPSTIAMVGLFGLVAGVRYFRRK
jgi:hypothetical protein